MKYNQGLILSATVLATLAMGATTLTANAATTYKRSKISKVSSKAYYSQRQKGKTYQFKGTAKKLTFKANHALKNYTKTTWQASKKTTVTKHGKQYLYYYVKNSRNGATGWVYSKYLKAGKNFQATTPTTTTATTYTPAKAGKVYTLSGDNTYVKFSNGQVLKTSENYTQTQKRYVYKAGKKYLYYFVTSADKKVSGWTWHGYLKADSSTGSASTTTTTSTNTNTTTNTTTNTNSSTNSNTDTNTTKNEDNTPAWATYDGKRAPIVINQYELESYISDGNTYTPGFYSKSIAYTNVHYVQDKSNPYQNVKNLWGTHNGTAVMVDVDFVTESNAIVPMDGDIIKAHGDSFYSLRQPEKNFNPFSDKDGAGAKDRGAYWYQYQPETKDYVKWQYNLKTGQWDNTGNTNLY